jgi:lysophospholipase L1-like esterase
MKALYSILITITAFTGCTKKNMDNTMPSTTTVSTKDTSKVIKDSLSYLALGDSYTIGEAVPAYNSYPYVLAAQLSKSYPVKTPPTIIATTGWTTDELINAIAQSNITNKKYGFVTLLIGVNDQYQHLSQDNYRTKFQQVLNTAINFANGNINRVFVISIPDWGVTPFASGQDSIIGPQIDQFNSINKEISAAAGVTYVDITAISRLAAKDPTLIAADGLHPSAKMYQQWLTLLEPAVAAKLKSN